MTVSRLAAIIFIFFAATIAWFILGTSVTVRTGESDSKLAAEVASLWGGRHVQDAPEAWYEVREPVSQTVQDTDAQGRSVTRTVEKTVARQEPARAVSSRIGVDIGLDQRRKGLLWYDTYTVVFQAVYLYANPTDTDRQIHVRFAFPSSQALYDAFVFDVGGSEVPFSGEMGEGIVGAVVVPAGGEVPVRVTYRSRGLGDWTYRFAPSGIAQIRNFRLVMNTDFDGIDFPAGTLSPTSIGPRDPALMAETVGAGIAGPGGGAGEAGEHPAAGRAGTSRTEAASGRGRTLVWSFESLVTGQQIGMDPPNPINPGPLTSRITYFAPVALLFFMTVMVMLGVLRGPSLHPMHYFFLAAGFFAFHLLLAYLVDHIDINLAFLISAVVSVFLVVSYLRLVGGMRFALRQAGAAQLVFLVLFSYAFFFEGYTGLTIAVGAVVTLFILMQVTGRVDWAEVFARRESPSPGPAVTATPGD